MNSISRIALLRKEGWNGGLLPVEAALALELSSWAVALMSAHF